MKYYVKIPVFSEVGHVGLECLFNLEVSFKGVILGFMVDEYTNWMLCVPEKWINTIVDKLENLQTNEGNKIIYDLVELTKDEHNNYFG